MNGRAFTLAAALILSVPALANAAPVSEVPNAAAPAPNAPVLEHRLSAFSTTAFGLSGSGFVNELAGARFELGYTPRFSLGFSLAYANLKGKDGRASNVLPEALLGYRIPVSRVVGIPVHLAGGYLAKNGPTLRLGAGFDFALGERVHLDLTLLEPMVWVVKNRPESSLDLGLALAMTL
jgi:hypothetical protein